jgi:hypothetical protein
VLTAVLIVTPGTKNHVKFAVQDALDRIYDSWVIIKKDSLVPVSLGTYAPLRWNYSAATGLYSGQFSIANNTSVNIPGPLFLIFNNLPAGVILANPTGKTPSGKLYIKLPGTILKAGSLLSVNVLLKNPLHQNLGTFFIHSGTIDFTNILT